MSSTRSKSFGLHSGDEGGTVVSSLNSDLKASPSSSKTASPSSTSSPPPPLQFITLTERPASQKNDYSHTVRSHAMQAFLREKKNANGDKAKQRLGPAKEHDPQTPKELSGKFKLASWSRKPRSKKVKTRWTREETAEPAAVKEEDVQIESQPSTPVDTYGNELLISLTNARTRELLYHCILPPSLCPLCLAPCTDNTAFISNTFAINHDNAWKPYSITDSALFHATLCLVAQHEDLLRGTDESSENLFHKGEAMRLMNRRLLDNWHSLSDADITAVAIFVILESINGTFEAASAHQVGLLKMTKLRGGIGNFELHRVVLRVLAWSDIVFSTRFGFAPRFSSISEDFASSFHPPSPTNNRYSTVFNDPTTTSIFQTLRYISSTIDVPNLSSQDKKSISDALYHTEYKILTSPQLSHFQDFDSPAPTEIKTTPQKLTAAFHIASHLYLHLMMRELPNPALLHRRFLSQLSRLVNDISTQISVSSPISLSNLDPALHPETPSFSKEELDVMLWVVFVGVAASSDRESKITFLALMPSMFWSEREDVGQRLR
ncbi:uncharacterized protein LY89DRAFT_716012, partial [Mollisia scopiformis]